MMDKADQKRLMLEYLFGELPADKRSTFEDTYLKDSDVFQELVSLENEIVDGYVLNKLSVPERQRFERSLLTNPARREMVQTARSLLSYSASAESEILLSTSGPTRAWWRTIRDFRISRAQFGVAAAFLIIIAGAFSLLLINRKLANELEKVRSEEATAVQQRNALQEQVQSLRADLSRRDHDVQQIAELPSYDRGTVSFTLDPGLSRGNSELAKLVIPAHASSVRLRMIVDLDPDSSSNVSVETPDGTVVWSQANIKGRATSDRNQEIAVTLPSRVLKEGDYVARVRMRGNADQDLAGYAFHVVRR
jgi:anti-sigma-K factor RskA